mmetsp:Transcript_4768/g.18018  ORF Transcript_4768/g.18018 Transcript_4768/m.18018 type:complete len:423 (-) Transcript_4768:317-1585(-)
MRRHVLRPGAGEDLVATVLHQGQLSRLEDHADRRVVEKVLLSPGRVPRDLRQPARLQVAQQQTLRRGGNEEALLEDVDLLDLEADVTLQHDAGTRRQALDNDLAQRHVSELMSLTVPRPPDANVEHVDATAQGADDEPGAVRPPRQRRDRVEVRHLPLCNFAPLPVLRMPSVDQEAVEVPKHDGLTRGVECRARELFDLRVRGVVEGLPLAALGVPEADRAVVAGRHDAGIAPRQGVGDALGNHGDLRARWSRHRLGLEAETPDGAVEVPCYQRVAVGARNHGDDEGVGRVKRGRLVRLQLPNLDLALGQAEHQLVGVRAGPAKASDARRLGELVANRLLVLPIVPELVHENDVVALGDRQLRAVGRELDRLNNVGPHHLVGRLRAKTILLVAVLVEELDDLVRAHCRQSRGVATPRDGRHL